MHYYIDGHNLIPKVNGIHLSDDQDEQALLERIQEYVRISRKSCTVFFDKAPENKTRDGHYGTVHVIYVTHHMKADEEIIARINKLGKMKASEVTVVSSDQHVQWQCHQAGAAIMTSEKFASEMNKIFMTGKPGNKINRKSSPKLESKLSPSEVEEWLRIFNEKK